MAFNDTARVLTLVVCAASFACTQGRPTASTRAAASASAAAVHLPGPPPARPSVASETRFSFVAELPDGVAATLFRLPSGIALFESSQTGWQLRVARGRESLSTVAALHALPESRQPREALFVGQTGADLWVSLANEAALPALELTTLRVNGQRVQRTSGKWYRALAELETGEVIGLPSSESPVLLADQSAQRFERIVGKRFELPSIASELRLYDVDILANGEIYALAVRDQAARRSWVAWLWAPGGPPRILEFPLEVAEEAPRLVRGGVTFLASVGSQGLWLGEHDGTIAVVKHSRPHSSAALSANGELWFAEESKTEPRLKRGRLDFARRRLLELREAPLPPPEELAVAGASAKCQQLGPIESIAPLPDGHVWLIASCLNGAHALLRGVRP